MVEPTSTKTKHCHRHFIGDQITLARPFNKKPFYNETEVDLSKLSRSHIIAAVKVKEGVCFTVVGQNHKRKDGKIAEPKTHIVYNLHNNTKLYLIISCSDANVASNILIMFQNETQRKVFNHQQSNHYFNWHDSLLFAQQVRYILQLSQLDLQDAVVFLCGIDNEDNLPHLVVISQSIIEPLNHFCLGKDAASVEKRLKKKWKADMPLNGASSLLADSVGGKRKRSVEVWKCPVF
ncbi:unnamed protein product [Ambrosiozyma monospora]|uniref:Unnamed protein product n=1 Tax=Ambrosiozyma monospora TaxID=43982 RepID=A0A9W6YWI5_AMBMO|nr:unnamed protein product [Ambrosiozyma monospora]